MKTGRQIHGHGLGRPERGVAGAGAQLAWNGRHGMSRLGVSPLGAIRRDTAGAAKVEDEVGRPGFACSVLGPPVTKKNSQRVFRNRKTGKPFIVQSKQAKAWETSAVLQLRAAWRGRAPLTGQVSMAAVFYRTRRVGDLGNFLAAVCDAIERAGIVANDKQIVRFDGSRLDADPKNPRVEILIREVA